MSERIWGALRKNAPYKSTYTLRILCTVLSLEHGGLSSLSAFLLAPTYFVAGVLQWQDRVNVRGVLVHAGGVRKYHLLWSEREAVVYCDRRSQAYGWVVAAAAAWQRPSSVDHVWCGTLDPRQQWRRQWQWRRRTSETCHSYVASSVQLSLTCKIRLTERNHT